MKTLEELLVELRQRQVERPEGSRTVELLDGGVHSIGKKVLEEAGETWIAAEYEGAERTAEELSQLLYHMAVLMVAQGLTIEDIYRRL